MVDTIDERVFPTCTVVVFTRERPQALAECLAALSKLRYPCFDVLVVNNGHSGGPTETIAARWGATYTEESRPGLSRARNRGARLCNSEIVAFLDDDAVPDPEWLTRLTIEFADAQVMVVTGRTLPTSPNEDSLPIGQMQRRIVDRQKQLWFELANFGGLGDGGNNMAFRRAAFDIWPGFDERLGRGAPLDASEEHHAFFRLLDAGYRAVYAPNAVVHHRIDQSPQRRLRHLTASTAYFTLLFVEEPCYRWRVARYVLQAALRRRRSWREETLIPDAPVSMLRRICACFSGPVLYARTRISEANYRRASSFELSAKNAPIAHPIVHRTETAQMRDHCAAPTTT